MLANRIRMGTGGDITELDAGGLVAYEVADIVNHNTATYTKKRSVRTNLGGTVTVTFSLARFSVTTGQARGQVHVNGVGVGVIRSSKSMNYANYTENFAVQPSDEIELYLSNGGTPNLLAGNNLFQISVAKLPPAGTFVKVL